MNMNAAEKTLEDSEIMNLLLKDLRFSALAFAKELEYKSHSSIHHILNGKNKISDDLVNRTIKRFPEVNYLFMKKGKYPILLPDKISRNQLSFSNEIGKKSKNSDAELLQVLKGIDEKMDIIIAKLAEKNI